MISYSVTSDLKKLSDQLGRLSGKHYRFAVALALTTTGKRVQAEVQRNIPLRFTLRRDWIVKGIRIIPATKDNHEVVIYSRDSKYMTRQELGGDKVAMEAGGKYIAIPLSGVKRTKSQLISQSDLPKNLKNSYVIEASDGRKYIAVRRGNRSILMYELIKRAHVKPRLGLVKDGERITKKYFAVDLEAAIKVALRTAL